MSGFRSIRSRAHPLIRRVRSLARSAERRREEQVYLAEGVRWAEEALASPQEVRGVLVSPRLTRTDRGRRLRDRLGSLPCEQYEIPDAILDAAGDARTPPGVLLLLRRPEATIASLERRLRDSRQRAGIVVVAVGIQDPGNLGGVLRSARCLGAAGFASCAGADLFHPRAVRACAGSLLHLPVACAGDPTELVRFLGGLEARAAVARGGEEPAACDWSGLCALVLGGEASGLPPEVERACRGRVTLGMSPGCESLNVGAAAAALLALIRDTRLQ